MYADACIILQQGSFSTAPDPCSTAPCHVNASCAQVGLSSDFTCSCTFPLTGDGSNTETGCVGA